MKIIIMCTSWRRNYVLGGDDEEEQCEYNDRDDVGRFVKEEAEIQSENAEPRSLFLLGLDSAIQPVSQPATFSYSLTVCLPALYMA